jgi:hypothetical protein
VRPASYSVPDDIRATLVRLLAYMGGLAVLAVAAASFFQAPAGVAALGRAPAARPAWTAVERPYPAFELLMPELAGSTYNYAIQRRAADGARKDMLTWGDATAAGPFVLVEIYRTGSADDRFIDASSEIGARIIDYTVTDDVKPIGQIDSKFGPVQIVDFAIAPRGQEHDQEHGHERRCLGFARPFNQPALQLAGWYCSAGREVVDRTTLACLLDRLTLVNGDQNLAELFAHAEVKRTFCGQRSPILAATPEREGQIAPGRSTKPKSALRGRVSPH